MQVASLTGWGWVALLYLAVVATFLAYIGWYWSLMHLDASELTVFLNVIPVEALALGALVRGESMHPLYLVGAGVIIIGVYLTQSSSAPPAGGAGGDAASGPSAPEVGTGGAGEETWTQR